MALILNQAQAEAVYSAMCALNNVGGRIDVLIPNPGGVIVQVQEMQHGEVWVFFGSLGSENYADQSAFAAAYGLQQG